jgi:peptidoglycan/LPS O-acetylase OafA/YrhL
VYILHFPVIQLLLQAGWFAGNPYGLLVTTILITAAAAIAMWHLVEKRWLLRSSHYVAATVRSPEATPGLVPVPSTSPRS